MKKFLLSVITLGFLLLLLVFPTTTLHGAKNGLTLWFQTVLPTLLPFMILSNLLIQFHITDTISSIFYPVAKRLLGISKKGCYPMVIGLLSGYPVGAKACADLVKSGDISRQEGQFLLCFCNNASPMFLLSFIAMQCLNWNKNAFVILAIIYASGFSTGFVFRLLETLKSTKHAKPIQLSIPCKQPQKRQPAFLILDNTILNAFIILVKVGGYIILFSILVEVTLHLAFLPSFLKYFLLGFLEITTGAVAITASSFAYTKKIVLIIALAAFGGLSSHAQTYSVILDSGLSIKTYFIFKCVNGVFAAIYTLFLINII